MGPVTCKGSKVKVTCVHYSTYHVCYFVRADTEFLEMHGEIQNKN